jgi:dihydrofolate reductase
LARLTFEISMSLDGFVAGPNPSREEPLGEGGEGLHEWGIRSAAWREAHGLEGGERSADSQLLEESIARAGATIMGKRMFGGGDGPWDESWQGWWGDEPPFGHQVFVLTHHPREPLEKGNTTFTFVEGIEPALEQARAVVGDGEDVVIGGGADVIQQYLKAGLVDELTIHLVPILLGGGVRLFGDQRGELECTRVIESPVVTHLTYRPPR